MQAFMNDSTLLIRKQENRIAWVDWAKGWTILFVVMYHAFKSVHDANIFSQHYQYLGEWAIFFLSTFIMPVFFALSGLVYKEISNWTEYKKNMLKRIVSLVIPYIIFSAAYVFMQNLSPGSSSHAVHSWSSLLYIFTTPISYLWYIYTLVLIYLFCGVLDLCKVNISAQFGISLVLFIIISFIKVPTFLYLIFTWTVTFNLGRLLIKHQNLCQDKWVIISFIVMVVSWAIQIQSGGKNWYDTNNLTLCTFFSKMTCIPVFFYIYSKLRENCLNNYFKKVGCDSLIVYLVHAPTVSVMRALFAKIGITNYLLMITSVILFSWLISIAACYLAKRITIIEFIFYPTRYIHLPK